MGVLKISKFLYVILLLFVLVVSASQSVLADHGGPCDPGTMPKAVNNSPSDGAQDLSLEPTLEVFVTQLFQPPCAWSATIWEISDSSQFTFFAHRSFTEFSNLTSYTVPAGDLQPNTQYWWRALIVHDYDGVPGGPISFNYGEVSSFTTGSGFGGGSCMELPTPNGVTPQDGATDVNTEPVLEIKLGTLLNPPCSWDATEFSIWDGPPPSNLVFSVQMLTPDFLYPVQPGTLQPNTQYCWTAVIWSYGSGIGGANINSNDAPLNCFTTESSGGGLIPPIGPTPPPSAPPPPSGSSLTSYDTNNNCALDDAEFFQIIDLWISQKLDNLFFFAAVDAWIGQIDICNVASMSHKLREVYKVSLTHNLARNSITLRSQNESTVSLQAHIFSLDGRLIADASGEGDTLTLSLRDRRPLANGVYFYQVTTYDAAGNVSRSTIRKFVMLR